MMHSHIRGLLLGVAVLLSPAALATSEGSMWSFEDSNGVTHFSNVPDNSRYRLVLKDPGSYRLNLERNEGETASRTKASRIWTSSQDKLPFAEMVTAAACP